MRFKVALNTVEDVNKFCAVASGFIQDIDVKYKHYTLDAKSVLGVQSIPRNESLEVYIHNVDLKSDEALKICEKFEPFIVR